MKENLRGLITASLFAALLSACGGGGGGSHHEDAPPGPLQPSADGTPSRRIEMTIIDPIRAQQVNSRKTTRLMTVNGQVVTKDQGAMAIAQGGVACAITTKNLRITGGTTLVAAKIDARLTPETQNTRQLVAVFTDPARTRVLVTYCAKLGADVTFGELQRAFAGIIEFR